MAFAARIVEDSLSPDGVRLTTFEVTHPRPILAEVNTHKMISKNSASSRAIPVATLLQRVKDDPYTPIYWGANKKGMQAAEELDEATQKLCLEEWLAARDDAMRHADRLRELGLHKQDANRLLEPFMWHTALLSGTEWSNFFHLRNHPDAHPAFQTVAAMMQELYEELTPKRLNYGQWHLPLVDDSELFHASRVLADHATGKSKEQLQSDIDEQLSLLVKVSTARCARISTLKHGDQRDLQDEINRHDDLLSKGHMSPLEHVARPIHDDDYGDDDLPLMVPHKLLHDPHPVALHRETYCGNFRGWVQYRKTIPHEHDILGPR